MYDGHVRNDDYLIISLILSSNSLLIITSQSIILLNSFIKCDFCEESGHGVPTVVEKYGIDSYEFMDNFIDVTIPFDKTGFGDHEPQNEPQKQMDLIERIIDIIKNNPSISKAKMAELLGVSLSTVKRELSKCNKIKYVGSSKGGHWEIKEFINFKQKNN